jgi:hypothetical protein
LVVDVVVTGEVSDASRSISALTALPRTDWAKIWKAYFKRGYNRKSFASIEKSILLVVLSDKSPTGLTEKGKFLIHADGKTLWFDKTVNAVFFKNGVCGLWYVVIIISNLVRNYSNHCINLQC